MTRHRLLTVACVVILGALAMWVARHTYWDELEVPRPLSGEARTNPFYAAQRFAEALDASTRWDRIFTPPPPDAAIVLSSWHWSLIESRRHRVERWVESGGRLIADQSLVGEDAFARWSGIEWKAPEDEEVREYLELGESEERCQTLVEHAATGTGPGREKYALCGILALTSLTSSRPVEWALENDAGLQVLRIRMGKGTVTVINAVPFTFRSLFEGDHARLFVAATQLHEGDQIHFLNEDDHPSLLALLWQFGWPAVGPFLLLVALALWRSASRLGPLVAPDTPARRSLGEQIRGTGRFALRHGAGQALHAAMVRALGEAAARRIGGYLQMPADDRITAIARLAGCDAQALGRAMDSAPRRPHDLRQAIALVESVRRGLSIDQRGTRRGRH